MNRIRYDTYVWSNARGAFRHDYTTFDINAALDHCGTLSRRRPRRDFILCETHVGRAQIETTDMVGLVIEPVVSTQPFEVLF